MNEQWCVNQYKLLRRKIISLERKRDDVESRCDFDESPETQEWCEKQNIILKELKANLDSIKTMIDEICSGIADPPDTQQWDFVRPTGNLYIDEDDKYVRRYQNRNNFYNYM